MSHQEEKALGRKLRRLEEKKEISAAKSELELDAKDEIDKPAD